MFKVTGRLKRDAHRSTTKNPDWVQYLVSVSLKRKAKQQDGTYQDEWTDFSANIMAKTGAQDDFYGQMLRQGNVVELSAEFIAPKSREHQGKTYLEIRMENCRLLQVIEAVKRDSQNGSQRQSNGGNSGRQQQYSGQQNNQSQQNGWAQQQQTRQPQNEPPMDFDDDIPF